MISHCQNNFHGTLDSNFIVQIAPKKPEQINRNDEISF